MKTILLSVGLCVYGFGQTPNDRPVRVGSPGVVNPVPVKKPEPTYSAEARAAHIQGDVMVGLRVDQQGLPQMIEVISPLGYGLDERAVDAVGRWRFMPGTKDGQAVIVEATIQVTFRLLGVYFDEGEEKRRSRYNVAVAGLRREPEAREKALSALAELAKKKFAPAQYLYGQLLEAGNTVRQDEKRGSELIRLAAKQKYGPALYHLASEKLRQGLDVETNRTTVRDAAILGRIEAQYFIAASYEQGINGYPLNLDSAMQFYRMCAAGKVGVCQFRLGQLLWNRSPRSERDLLVGTAWMQMAAKRNANGAREALDDQGPLEADQQEWIQRLIKDLEGDQ